MVGLFEAAVTASSLEHVSFRDNSVIIFTLQCFVAHHDNICAAIVMKTK